LITHHPLIFKAIKNINLNTALGKCLELALKNDLTIYTMHTNFDSVSDGLNYTIAKDMGLDDISILNITYKVKVLKLVTFVPLEYTLKVLEAICDAGAGKFGKLVNYSYTTTGSTTFSKQHIDNTKNNENESSKEVPEERLEIVVPENKLEKVISALKKAHPYEDDQISFDVYGLKNKYQYIGIGTVGEFYTPFTLSEVIEIVKKNLKIKNIKFVGDSKKQITRVAVCTGSGKGFLKIAKESKADLYITGDIDYHTAIEAKDLDIALIDAGHYATEILSVAFISNYIKEHFNNIPKEDIIEILEHDPFSYTN